MSPLETLLKTGTKLFLDSVEPAEVDKSLGWGATGATSNPAIISAIIDSGSRNAEVESLLKSGLDDEAIAWQLTDQLVSEAEEKFLPIYKRSGGNEGWVSFELDPLLEDPDGPLSTAERTAKYIELGKRWAKGHTNRMIKVPATEAGIDALEELAAAGVTLNVTLMFTEDQYTRSRDAIWRGAQRRSDLNRFKSVYSIFISRIDVFTSKHLESLSSEAQGQVGLLNAKRIWKLNQSFWADKGLPLQQELIFASTGTKDPSDSPTKYVEAIAGSDIQTNPPELNEAVQKSGITFSHTLDQMPSQAVQAEIDEKLDVAAMHEFLLAEGVDKFIKPQQALLRLIAKKREELA
ncbi:Transaldolase [Novipirellula aureliae]|uniref:Transaldolase n=1 Tax=Novipirellula aureliae TaxID=2527966 RepID=A0A5C6E0B2_9BACT|nr:transaldolase family protein [Novipirellula aureliae]TWU43123.1 Transaldolase [Novipirellula aureliae]